MNKQIIAAGHCKISPLLLEEVIKDSPRCTGNKQLTKCYYSRKECIKECYSCESESCMIFHYLNKYGEKR